MSVVPPAESTLGPFRDALDVLERDRRAELAHLVNQVDLPRASKAVTEPTALESPSFSTPGVCRTKASSMRPGACCSGLTVALTAWELSSCCLPARSRGVWPGHQWSTQGPARRGRCERAFLLEGTGRRVPHLLSSSSETVTCFRVFRWLCFGAGVTKRISKLLCVSGSETQADLFTGPSHSSGCAEIEGERPSLSVTAWGQGAELVSQPAPRHWRRPVPHCMSHEAVFRCCQMERLSVKPGLSEVCGLHSRPSGCRASGTGVCRPQALRSGQDGQWASLGHKSPLFSQFPLCTPLDSAPTCSGHVTRDLESQGPTGVTFRDLHAYCHHCLSSSLNAEP